MERKTRRKTALLILLVTGWLALSVILVGCGTRTIYVQAGEPVRLRKTVKQAPVWVLDGKGVPTAGEVDLPEGWYALPDPGVKK